MKYLITGGAGFIGGHLAQLLLNDSACEKVIVIDDLSTGSLDNLKLIADDPKLEVVISDITDPKCDLRKYVKEVDCIYHLAAAVGVELVGAERNALVDEMIMICREEVKNAEETIPIVEFDSRLGYEPTMEYMTDKAHIEWKLGLIKHVIEKELPSYYEK